MDAFTNMFYPAGLATATVHRHLPIFRRCVDADDAAVLVTRVRPSSRSRKGDFLLLLTHRRLVVTRESRLFRRLDLHLNADLRHLSNVAWSTDPRDSTIELGVTAVDGVRERFRMRAGGPENVRHLESLLTHLFVEHRRIASLVA